jgi:hypothetical protein
MKSVLNNTMLLQVLTVTLTSSKAQIQWSNTLFVQHPTKGLQNLEIYCSVIANNCQIISNRLCQNMAFVLGSYQPFHFTLVCCLINVPNNSSDYTASNGSIINESTGKDEEVSVSSSEVQSWHLPGRTEENEVEKMISTSHP